MAVPAQHPFEWFVGALTYESDGIFKEDFYPAPNKQGERTVWFAPVRITETYYKFIVVSKITGDTSYGGCVKIISPTLFEGFLEPRSVASKADTTALNVMTEHIIV